MPVKSCLLVLSLLLLFGACKADGDAISAQPRLVEYSAADGTFSYVFTGKEIFSGFLPDLIKHKNLVEGNLRTANTASMKCILVGDGEYATSYAVPTPIKLKASYKCANTEFEVISCNGGRASCETALIMGRYRPPMIEDRKAYQELMFFYDHCRGMTSFINQMPREERFAFGRAVELRSYSGILADESSAECKREKLEFDSFHSG